MKPVDFDEVNVKIAEEQDEYVTLPAHINSSDDTCPITFCMELTEDEIIELSQTKKLFIQILTFKTPMQPIAFFTKNPLK